MKSINETDRHSSTNPTGVKLAAQIFESAQGIREWAANEKLSISATYDTCLIALANDKALRDRILEAIDHSAARVFCETGDARFDSFVGTILSMQVLARGTAHKYALEQLSMELLDTFLVLRELQGVTKTWLSLLMSHKYQTGDLGVYRFGELARIALLAASLFAYHDGDVIFSWAIENREGIEESNPRQWSRAIQSVLASDGYPPFELWVVHFNDHSIARRVTIDTDSLFCRRLLREAICAQDIGDDALHINGPFFNEFTQSIGFTPTELMDFTPQVFMRQASWFRQMPECDARTLRFLCRFYSHILSPLLVEQSRLTDDTNLMLQLIELRNCLEQFRANRH